RGRRVADLVAGHAVDVARAKPGVGHRLADRLARHRERGAVGGAHVRRLADANDAVLVSQASRDLTRSAARAVPILRVLSSEPRRPGLFIQTLGYDLCPEQWQKLGRHFRNHFRRRLARELSAAGDPVSDYAPLLRSSTVLPSGSSTQI